MIAILTQISMINPCANSSLALVKRPRKHHRDSLIRSRVGTDADALVTVIMSLAIGGTTVLFAALVIHTCPLAVAFFMARALDLGFFIFQALQVFLILCTPHAVGHVTLGVIVHGAIMAASAFGTDAKFFGILLCQFMILGTIEAVLDGTDNLLLEGAVVPFQALGAFAWLLLILDGLRAVEFALFPINALKVAAGGKSSMGWHICQDEILEQTMMRRD